MKAFFQNVGKVIKAHKIVTCLIALLIALVIVFSCLGALIFNRYSVGTVPTDSDLAALKANNQVYSRVVIFGVDGAGGYFGDCDTPSFDRIFEGGSVTYNGMSQTPTVSAQNWAAMLHGVRYQKHGIDNEKAGSQDYSNKKYPSVFKVYDDRHPGTTFASVCNWGPINKGIVEKDLNGMTRINAGEDLDDGEDVDAEVKNKVVEYVQTNDPKILFMQFDGVDHAGHSHGYGSKEFEEEVQHVDGLMGEIYDAYVANGWQNDTLFICVSDHGHTKIGGHGGNTVTERNVTVAVNGGLGNIIPGTPGKVVTQDIAAIVFYGLGEKQHENWECKVPSNMFSGLN